MAVRSSNNLHELPRFRDGWSFLYVDKAVIDREKNALSIQDKNGRVAVPTAALSTLMLGPGVSITHAAVCVAGDCGVSIIWCGEGAVRFYAAGGVQSRRATNLHKQAEAWASDDTHIAVVQRMYRMRFSEPLEDGLSLPQIRGREGVRVREAYAKMSRETGVPWAGRQYKQGSWLSADPVNRALSAANACLYGVCHAGIVAGGFNPGLGFIHTGKLLAFVYDVADLYKLEVTVPAAFHAVKAGGSHKLSSRVRRLCRAAFHRHRVLERVIPDIQMALGMRPERVKVEYHRSPDVELAEEIGSLWDPVAGSLRGGRNFGPLLDVPPYESGDEEVPF